jgi:formamidopyrimidine-DNA glycosylase
MPELPEVEIQTRQLRRRLVGARISRIESRDPKIRLPEAIVGNRINHVRRRGKFIIFELSGGKFLLAHLRMTGWFEFREPPRLRAALHTTRGSMYFEDRRRLGQLRVVDARELRKSLAGLGPEPLAPKFDLSRLRQTSRPVKIGLLDQRIVAGVGNIYASEALWRARIDPHRQSRSLRDDELSRLRTALVRTLRNAIRLGERIFEEPNVFAVYGRAGKPCRRCSAKILRIVQGQRSTYFCPRCQGSH